MGELARHRISFFFQGAQFITERKLCSDPAPGIAGRGFVIVQNDVEVCTPKRGPVLMQFTKGNVLGMMGPGWMTLRSEMYDSDDSRITDFEGTIWVG